MTAIVTTQRRSLLSSPIAAAIAVLLVVGVLFPLSGQAATTTKLVVMDWKLNETPATERWFQHVKEQFEQRYPGVEIEYTTAAWGNEYREAVLVQSAAGLAPDVIALSIIWARDFWDDGLLLNLNPYIDRTPELHPDEFIPATQLYNQVNGQVYGITNAMDETLLIYDIDALEETGLSRDPNRIETWVDFLDATKKLTLVGADGNVVRYGLAMGIGDESFSSWLTSNGGSFYSEDMTKAGFNSQEGLETAQLFLDLQNADVLGGSVGAKTAAIQYGINSTPYFLDRDAPDLNYLVTAFPQGPSGHQRGSTVWGNMHSISRTSQNPDLAWEFIKFYTGLEGNIGIFEALDYVNSPRLDFYQSDTWYEARERRPWMPAIPEIAFVGGLYPFLKHHEMNSKVWTPLLRPALIGETADVAAFQQAEDIYNLILAESEIVD